ncbi:alpha/beta hydrolase [Pollutibacter soli]|uniref:alpha/beta hydrolase n=1 Tax=Pollutibacter soli TaxID=3034157 RepID=UPI0030137E77
MKAYLIGGLAADERVFRHIRFPDNYEPVFLNWIVPEKNESLVSYARRMAGQMDTSVNFILVGVSFGGMLAVEISRLFPSDKTILIASVPEHKQLPGYFRWMYKAGLPRFVPISLIKNGVMFRRLFTAETNEDKDIIRSMVRNADPGFIRWAMIAALEWEAVSESSNYVHIHGTDDFVFPHRYTKPSHTIIKGGHLMVMDRADDINSIIAEVLLEKPV